MSSNTKVYEEKMKSSVEHLGRELAAVRAGRANPAVLDKVTVDYYGAPTPIQQVASVAVSEARTLTITPWDRTLLRAISKAIMASDVGINPHRRRPDHPPELPGSHRGAPQAAGQGSLQAGRGGQGGCAQHPPRRHGQGQGHEEDR
mgnify:CR=1 FL=1